MAFGQFVRLGRCGGANALIGGDDRRGGDAVVAGVEFAEALDAGDALGPGAVG
ncbi:MAG TPA: hypothetical protein VGM32_02830 [Rhodopila sp.]